MFIIIPLNAFALENDMKPIFLSSEVGSFSAQIKVQPRISIFATNKERNQNIKEIENEVEIETPVHLNDKTTIVLDIISDAYLLKKKNDSSDDNIILIYGEDGFLIGAVEQSYVTDCNGNVEKVNYVVNSDTIECMHET